MKTMQIKTLRVLDKYQKLISGRLNCDPKEIKFFRDGLLVGELSYYKTEEEARKYAKDQGIPFNMENYTFVKQDWGLGSFEVRHNGELISSFKLYQLPHCCAFAVSCNAQVYEGYRNNRIGTILNSFRQDISRLLGYSSLLCTDIESNKYQRQLLETQGWKDIHDVINKRTSNRVFLSVINI
jgi:hypothetical protein